MNTSLEFSRTTTISGRRVYLVQVARCQRTLLFVVLGALLCYAALAVTVGIMGATAQATGARTGFRWVGILMLVPLAAWVALAITAIVQTVRLAIATGRNKVVACLASILMIVPFIGLLVMGLANARANKVLKEHGVKIGFMGVNRAEMQKIIVGACASCGYDIRNLPEPRCPECGTPIAPSQATA